MRRRTRSLFLFAVLVATVGCDQATKVIATRTLKDTPPRSYLGDLFRLVYAENPGAFLGLGGELGATARFWILIVVVGLALLAGLVYVVRHIDKLNLVQLTAAGLLIAGGGSNWYDRLVNDQRVVDFMILGIGSIRTGIFNVADLAIMIGVGLLFLPHKKEPAAPAASGGR